MKPEGKKMSGLSSRIIYDKLRKMYLGYLRLRGERRVSLEEFCRAMLLNTPDNKQIEELAAEFQGDQQFFFETNRLSFKHRKKPVKPAGWSIVHYIITRIIKPELIIETGVFDGHSSACWLLALNKNARGKLISIALPAHSPIADSIHTALPSGLQPGWLVPDYLKDRHELILGDAKAQLPAVLDANPGPDIFFHDSLHTREHMLFEFHLALSRMQSGGIILSDDYTSYNSFARFTREIGKSYFFVYNGLAGIKI